MDIMTIVLIAISTIFLFSMIFNRISQSKVEDKLISVVMDVHDLSKFYHNAGRSSAEHQLQVERMNIERLQAEADKATSEARLMEQVSSNSGNSSSTHTHTISKERNTHGD